MTNTTAYDIGLQQHHSRVARCINVESYMISNFLQCILHQVLVHQCAKRSSEVHGASRVTMECFGMSVEHLTVGTYCQKCFKHATKRMDILTSIRIAVSGYQLLVSAWIGTTKPKNYLTSITERNLFNRIQRKIVLNAVASMRQSCSRMPA
jgi:type II secretory ATPase GspE/PulE/Tfp pilus assembly ATPase PilB-like protein